jgi:hypothetical protein
LVANECVFAKLATSVNNGLSTNSGAIANVRAVLRYLGSEGSYATGFRRFADYGIVLNIAVLSNCHGWMQDCTNANACPSADLNVRVDYSKRADVNTPA